MALMRYRRDPFLSLWDWPDAFGGSLLDFPAWPGHEHYPYHVDRERMGGGMAWHPSVDMFEKDDKLYVKLDLPGMTKDDIDISFDGHVLSITGRREEQPSGDGSCYWSRERYTGDFHRYVHIPVEVSGEDLKAGFENGVLTVAFSQAEKAKRKKIAIESGSAS